MCRSEAARASSRLRTPTMLVSGTEGLTTESAAAPKVRAVSALAAGAASAVRPAISDSTESRAANGRRIRDCLSWACSPRRPCSGGGRRGKGPLAAWHQVTRLREHGVVSSAEDGAGGGAAAEEGRGEGVLVAPAGDHLR